MRLAQTFAAGLAILFLAQSVSCGGGGAPPEEEVIPGAYAARIIATKRSTGTLVNFDVSADYQVVYAAYGENGLVTMDISDFNDIRITRRNDDVRSSDVKVCGLRLYSLDYQPPPVRSRINTFDLSLDPLVPVKLGDLQIDLGAGAGIACAGDDLMVSAGSQGLYRITAEDLRNPEAEFIGDPTSMGAVAIYDLKPVSETEISAGVELPPDPACFPMPDPPCQIVDPNDPRLGRLGIRTLRASTGAGIADLRVPRSQSIDFPFLSGANTSPINYPLAAAVNGDLTLIVSSSGRRFTVYRGNTVLSSTNLGSLPASDIADIESAGPIAVVADGDIRVVDITDPALPKVATSVVTPGVAFSLKLRDLGTGDFYVYTADGENGLVIVSVERVKPVFVDAQRLFVVDGSVADLAKIPTHVPTSPLLSDPLGTANFLNNGLLVLSRSNGGVVIGDNIDRTNGGALPSVNPVVEITGGSLFTTSPPQPSLPGIVRAISRNAADLLDFLDVAALNARLILRALPLVRIPPVPSPTPPPYPDDTPAADEQLGPLSPFHAPTGIAVQNDGYPFIVSSGVNLNNIAQSEPVIAGGRAASIGPDGRPVTYVLEDPNEPLGPLIPAFPPRRGGPATGVWWGTEDWRDCSQLPSTRLGFRLRSQVTGAPAGLPCGSDALVPPGTSDALTHGLFGVVFGGIGVDTAQPDNPLSPYIDYFTRNPVYFATTGDGGIIEIDLDSGISQVAPPCTVRPLIPNVLCAANFPDAALVEDDPSLKTGMLYEETSRTLFVADPIRQVVQAVTLMTLDPGTIRGVWAKSGGFTLDVSGLLSQPVDLAPQNPPAKSPDHLRSSSDMYILNRGSSSIVKATQSGEFRDYIIPRVNGSAFDAGTFTALASSPDGTALYLAVENCPSAGQSCIYQIPAP